MIEQHGLIHAHICEGCPTLSVFDLCNERISQSYSSSAQIASTPVEADPTMSMKVLEIISQFANPFYAKVWQSEVEEFHPNFMNFHGKFVKHGNIIQPVERHNLTNNKKYQIITKSTVKSHFRSQVF